MNIYHEGKVGERDSFCPVPSPLPLRSFRSVLLNEQTRLAGLARTRSHLLNNEVGDQVEGVVQYRNEQS